MQELPEANATVAIIQGMVQAAEQKFIAELVAKFVGREPTQEDFTRIGKVVIKDKFNGYALTWDKVPIGILEFGDDDLNLFIGEDKRFKVKFTPNQAND